MKIKLVRSGFDRDTHQSYVSIQTRYGEFSGKSKTHKDDYDIENRYVGCEYAERKAFIKALKMKKRLLKERLDSYSSLSKDLKETNLTDEKTYIVICQYIKRTQKEYSNLKEEIKTIEEKLKNDMANRRQKIEENNKKRNNKVKWINLGEIDLSKSNKNEK